MRRLHALCWLQPGLRPGTVIEVQDLPGSLSGGPWLITRVHHVLAPEAGGTTTLDAVAGGSSLDSLLGAALFCLANIGASGSFVFYDSLLPHIAGPDGMDRVSTAAYAMGYLGGGLLLVINLLQAWSRRRFGYV